VRREHPGKAQRLLGLCDATPDHHPVLGAIAPYEGLFADFGLSGHGFKHSPLMGDIISEVILHAARRTTTSRRSAGRAFVRTT
jgi:glycine/D-amino acid oxidase-like deaminating enzyme